MIPWPRTFIRVTLTAYPQHREVMFVLLFTMLFTSTVSSPPHPDPLFTDADGDGYKGIVEVWWGCDQFDPNSLPYCVDGFDYSISCSPTGPGISVVLVPCDL